MEQDSAITIPKNNGANKFAGHQPLVGIACVFYFCDGTPAVTGVFNHGGVYGRWHIIDSQTGKHYDTENIESWEYLKPI